MLERKGMKKLHISFQSMSVAISNPHVKTLKKLSLAALFITTLLTSAFTEEKINGPIEFLVLSSKAQWLKFTGTNYCKPGQCLESVPRCALQTALEFYKNNQDKINNNDFLGVIDFTIKSTQKRFFIINLKTGSVESLLVTHGKKSETDLGVAGNFSNTEGSEMSSLGFFITDSVPYIGKHGNSLRLDGVSDSNSNARARNIVLHGADYATEWFATNKGRLGLSQGCLAVAPNKIAGVIEKLKGHALLYIHKNGTVVN